MGPRVLLFLAFVLLGFRVLGFQALGYEGRISLGFYKGHYGVTDRVSEGFGLCGRRRSVSEILAFSYLGV